MKRIKLTVAYDGTNYCGWQIQPNGITIEQVDREELPIPERDYCPQSLEEKIICYADKFYSKSHLGEEVDVAKIKYNIWKYGHAAFQRWQELVELMGETD